MLEVLMVEDTKSVGLEPREQDRAELPDLAYGSSTLGEHHHVKEVLSNTSGTKRTLSPCFMPPGKRSGAKDPSQLRPVQQQAPGSALSHTFVPAFAAGDEPVDGELETSPCFIKPKLWPWPKEPAHFIYPILSLQWPKNLSSRDPREVRRLKYFIYTGKDGPPSRRK